MFEKLKPKTHKGRVLMWGAIFILTTGITYVLMFGGITIKFQHGDTKGEITTQVKGS